MSKQIVTPTKNGAKNIQQSRLESRESNLNEDLIAWEKLSLIDTNLSLDDVLEMPLADTIKNRIIRLEPNMYDSNLGVTSKMIAQLAQEYLESPRNVQLHLCRDPSRQSVDEDVQLATLKAYSPNVKFEKLLNGKLTLNNGNLEKTKDKNGARSIDFFGSQGENEFYLFAKYAAGAGSAQTHQIHECFEWLEEAKKYCNKQHDKKLFIMLCDGEEAESHLRKMNEELVDYSNIFAGNCEQVIDFISKSIVN